MAASSILRIVISQDLRGIPNQSIPAEITELNLGGPLPEIVAHFCPSLATAMPINGPILRNPTASLPALTKLSLINCQCNLDEFCLSKDLFPVLKEVIFRGCNFFLVFPHRHIDVLETDLMGLSQCVARVHDMSEGWEEREKARFDTSTSDDNADYDDYAVYVGHVGIHTLRLVSAPTPSSYHMERIQQRSADKGGYGLFNVSGDAFLVHSTPEADQFLWENVCRMMTDYTSDTHVFWHMAVVHCHCTPHQSSAWLQCLVQLAVSPTGRIVSPETVFLYDSPETAWDSYDPIPVQVSKQGYRNLAAVFRVAVGTLMPVDGRERSMVYASVWDSPDWESDEANDAYDAMPDHVPTTVQFMLKEPTAAAPSS